MYFLLSYMEYKWLNLYRGATWFICFRSINLAYEWKLDSRRATVEERLINRLLPIGDVDPVVAVEMVRNGQGRLCIYFKSTGNWPRLLKKTFKSRWYFELNIEELGVIHQHWNSYWTNPIFFIWMAILHDPHSLLSCIYRETLLLPITYGQKENRKGKMRVRKVTLIFITYIQKEILQNSGRKSHQSIVDLGWVWC